MNKLTTAIKRYPLVAATVIVGLTVLILWLSHQDLAGQVIATVYVGGVVLWTAVGMIKDMLAGNFGLDVLAVLAMVTTLLVGQYGAAVVIVLMLTGGEALEDYANGRARSALTSLLDQSPQTALVIHNDPASGKEAIKEVPASEVKVGEHLMVRPGGVVPVDAEVLEGKGSFDESAITGESLPVELLAGGEVPSGSVNGDEAVRLVALRTTENSQYQQIVSLVADAEKRKAPVVRLADRFAVPFTVLAITIAGVAWFLSGDPVRAAEVLVLATPCPLLIAAPVAFMGGLSFSAKNGVILKGGTVLESLSRIESAAFDKTGTITGGHPEVIEVRPASGFDSHRLLVLAATVEQYSGHVLAAGIVRSAKQQGIALSVAQKAEETPGFGVSAVVEGKLVRVGSADYLKEALQESEKTALLPGQVASHVAVDGVYAGAIVLADQMRPLAPALVNYLRSHGVRNVEMLTGDSYATAENIAREVGITTVRHDLLPQQKVDLVAKIQPRPVLMVGDGVNDAPALASANVGIAMGARGATAAGEAADAVIVPDSVWKVADAHAIAKNTMRVALTAIWIGIALSVILMLIASTGAIPAIAGAFTQEIVDLTAILYALRALRGKLPDPNDYLPTVPTHEVVEGPRVKEVIGSGERS